MEMGIGGPQNWKAYSCSSHPAAVTHINLQKVTERILNILGCGRVVCHFEGPTTLICRTKFIHITSTCIAVQRASTRDFGSIGDAQRGLGLKLDMPCVGIHWLKGLLTFKSKSCWGLQLPLFIIMAIALISKSLLASSFWRALPEELDVSLCLVLS